MNPDFWRHRRVFLTGHTGFKGSWLALWLQQLGADLTGFSYDYSLAASAEDQQAALYVAATRLARAFGVDEPQWFRAPVDAAPLEGRTPVSPGA